MSTSSAADASPSYQLRHALSWDRRQTDSSTQRAIHILDRAARHLALDQMRPDRVYVAGALSAVTLLWSAMERVRANELAGQRQGRLIAEWLPRHAATRRDRSEAALAE